MDGPSVWDRTVYDGGGGGHDDDEDASVCCRFATSSAFGRADCYDDTAGTLSRSWDRISFPRTRLRRVRPMSRSLWLTLGRASAHVGVCCNTSRPMRILDGTVSGGRVREFVLSLLPVNRELQYVGLSPSPRRTAVAMNRACRRLEWPFRCVTNLPAHVGSRVA